MQVWNCPNCGNQCPAHASWCHKCGAPFGNARRARILPTKPVRWWAWLIIVVFGGIVATALLHVRNGSSGPGETDEFAMAKLIRKGDSRADVDALMGVSPSVVGFTSESGRKYVAGPRTVLLAYEFKPGKKVMVLFDADEHTVISTVPNPTK